MLGVNIPVLYRYLSKVSELGFCHGLNCVPLKFNIEVLTLSTLEYKSTVFKDRDFEKVI